MVEISHRRAQSLLQAATDRSLEAVTRSELDAHLATCSECQAYAARLSHLETGLRASFHTQWDGHRPHVNWLALKNESRARGIWANLSIQTNFLGKVTFIAALLVGYFLIVNLIGIRTPITGVKTPIFLPTPSGYASSSVASPTPSSQSPTAGLVSPICQTILYTVQKNDTLESIAIQHRTTREAILEYNKNKQSLASGKVFKDMELVIPLCEHEPSRTASLPSSVLTITPSYTTILPDQPE